MKNKQILKKRKTFLISLLVIITIGFLIPQNLKMPVKEASKSDYNPSHFGSFRGESLLHIKALTFLQKKEQKLTLQLQVLFCMQEKLA